MVALTSTVCPVVKSKMREFGVSITGSPNCWMVGAPSSRVQLVMKLSRSAGEKLRPAPIVVSEPKSDS